MTSPLAGGGSVTRRHNLPAEVASFVGRERAIAEIGRLLRQTRMLTLTGAGGCGKTRLALRVAAGLVQGYQDGIWLVPLAPLTDSAQIPRAVAAALGIRGTAGSPLLATLTAALAARRSLLLLDNCEHLIGGCARLAETMLRACPHLQILATSREPLRVSGEITWRVPPLDLPPAESLLLSPESLAQVEAVALFLDRARARRPAFLLTQENAPAVAAICREMAGIPLGIELAAAQTGTLTPEQIAARLDDALRLLGGGSRTLPRQETLRATLDWSHALLSGQEQTLLRRLAAFAGGFDLDSAEGVCGGDGLARAEVLPLLRALVEKSLVEPQIQAGDTRYRLLEPVRQYARAHLVASGEEDGLQRRHAQYFANLAEAAEPKLLGGGRRPWIDRLALEQDNCRAALSWSRRAAEAGDRAVGLRLSGALAWFWIFRGEVSEGLDWTEAALATAAGAAPALRAKALYAAGELGWLASQNDLARQRIEESVVLFRALGDRRGLAYALQSLPMTIDNPSAEASTAESLRLFEAIGDAWGAAMALFAVDTFALMSDRDPGDRVVARLEEALARWRRLGDDWGTAQVLNTLGDLARSRGDEGVAAAHYEEALVLLRRQGLTGSVPSLLHNLGYLAVRRGDVRRALGLFRESLVLFRDQGDQRGIADGLTGIAAALVAIRHPGQAARLLGAAEALRETCGATIWPANAADYEHTLRLARGRLGEPAFAAAWAAGRGLPPEHAVAEALATKAPSHPQDDAGGPDLTPREREIAALVAQGLTNRQIGAALFITEGTARLHVKHILRRLGFTSRAQVAAWAVERGLATAPDAQ